MYNEFFGFSSTPFDIVPNPDFLFLSERHKTALDHLEYGLMSGASFVLLTGEIGTGKTTLVREVLRRCIPLDTEVALIFQTNVTAEQLLNMLLTEFELPPHPGDKPAALDELNQFLVSRYSQNRRVLIVVDEAQNLNPEALEELRMLSNLQSDDRMLLQVILVGQPELKRKLLEPRLAQFAQRIAVNYHLTALSREETAGYIAHRLACAGGRTDIFTPEAVERVYLASRGVPRSINLVCASALLYAYAEQTTTVSDEHVRQAVEDKGGLGGTGGRTSLERVDQAVQAQYAAQPTYDPAPEYPPQSVYDIPQPVYASQPECAPATSNPATSNLAAPNLAALVQGRETNLRLGAMESDLRSLLDAFGSYEQELTKRIESIRSEDRQATKLLEDRCERLEKVVRHMAAPLVRQSRQHSPED